MNPTFWASYALRSLRRAGRRTGFALLCVAVGVAGVVALQVASLTIQQALTSNVRAANGGDISVSSESAPFSTSDLAIFNRLQRQGQIAAWTAVRAMHATAVGTSGHLIPFDVNMVIAPPYPLGGQPTFVTPAGGNVNALLQHPGDVLITSVLSDELGVHVGDHLLVNSLGGSGLHATVRGILAETNFSHAAVMTVEHRDAGVLSDRLPRYTAIYANVPGGSTSRATIVASAIRSYLPAASVQTVQDALNQQRTEVHDFRQFMLLVGLLALLIAGVGILNAIQSMLARRRLEIAVLKSMGFPQRTLYGLFGGEALLIGIIGGVVGTFVGVALSKIISDTLARAMAIQVSFVVDGTTIVGGIGLGIAATLVFAVLPIARATNVRPIEMLREETPADTATWAQTLGLLAVILLLFGALAAAIVGDAILAGEFVLGACVIAGVLAGLFALLIGWLGRLGPARNTFTIGVAVILVALTVVSAWRVPAAAAALALATILWIASVVLPRRVLLPLLLAVRSLSRRQARTSVTLVALLAGVLAMALTLTVALSLRDEIMSALSSRGTTNLVAITTPENAGLVNATTRSLPGVRASSSTTVAQSEPVAINGRPVIIRAPKNPQNGDEGDDIRARLLGGVAGWNLAAGDGPSNIDIVAGRALSPSDAGTNHVLLRSGLQYPPANVQVGDTVMLQSTSSSMRQTLQVVGFYHRALQQRGFGSFFTPPVLGDRSIVLRLAGGSAQTVVSYAIAPNQLTHDATRLQLAIPGALVIDIGDLTAVVEQILNDLLNLLAVITALVLGAGLAVVANGVALAMLERRREIALFKAIGFEPGSVLRFVLIENALVGLIAGVVSVGGTAIGLNVLSRLAFNRDIPFNAGLAVLVLAIATALAVGIAYLTARRPIEVRPLEALRNE